ncbi:MAG: glycosyltransferase family 9 protein [Candidatus Omnitrophica bacterium]|nr:glycosyltransferase family 9 protein [Candidatus Omnitrophota bacterium]
MSKKKILVVRNDRFGEFLLNIPAFRALKETYPEASLTVVVNPYLEELAKAIKEIDNVICWENKKHPFFEVFSFSRKLKKEKFDSCIILNPTKEFNLISFLAGISERIGYRRKWPFLLTKTIKDKKDKAIRHEVEYNLELVKLAGAETKNKSLQLDGSEQLADKILKEKGLEDNQPFIVVHPFTSDKIKQWPLDRFKKLIQKIVKELERKVVLVGGREEKERSDKIIEGLEGVINLTGVTSLVELASILKKAKLLVSCDSGPVHLAAAVDIPVVVLFRKDMLAKTAKRWGPWNTKAIIIEKYSLSDITVEEVMEKVRELIKITNF